MKHIKKILFILLIIIIILLVVFLFPKKENISPTNNITSNNIPSSNTNEDKNKSNFNGENAVIYLGTHSQYGPITVVLEMPDTKEELTKHIISKISSLIGYRIDVNYIKFEDKNIYIDFSNEYAPFNIENSKVDSEEKLYSLYGTENIIYTIFDSIAKTLTSYFGNDYNLYYSVNSENINITYNDFNLKVDSTKPYIIND